MKGKTASINASATKYGARARIAQTWYAASPAPALPGLRMASPRRSAVRRTVKTKGTDPDRGSVGQDVDAGERPPARQQVMQGPGATAVATRVPARNPERDTLRTEMQHGGQSQGNNALDQDLETLHRAKTTETAAALKCPTEHGVVAQQDDLSGDSEHSAAEA